MPEMGVSKVVTVRVMTTTERDALEAIEGMVIFNSTTDQLEEYDGATWQAVGQVIMDTHAALSIPHPNLDTKGMFLLIPFAALGTVGQGTWSNLISVTDVLTFNLRTSTKADADNISFEIYLDKGTYTLCVLLVTAADTGILDVDIGPTGGTLTEVASWDMYSASTVRSVEKTQASISIATAGRKTIKFRVDGKNGSSSSYGIYMIAAILWRTA